MCFTCMWRRLVRATPLLGDESERITFSVAEYRRALATVYRTGQIDNRERTVENLSVARDRILKHLSNVIEF